jgi:hypothetical protein
MDDIDRDPHDEIVRLEGEIEALAARIENCRKFILAARIAMAGGGIVLLAMLFGLIRFDATVLTLAFAALLGGIVVYGSNIGTTREAAAAVAAAEAKRAGLIGLIDPRVVGERKTLH